MRLCKGKSWFLAALGAAFLSVAVLGQAGCGPGGNAPTAGSGDNLGSPPAEDVPAVCSSCVSDEKVGQTVTVEGEVVQQCPASGCWFRMKDDAGEVFVDLNPAKLRLTEKREGQHARVTGRVAKHGGKFRLEARHVEFTPAKKDVPSGEK